MSRHSRKTRSRFPGIPAYILATLLVAVSLGFSTPALATNHYIVLFDGSGSMTKEHGEKRDLWQGAVGNSAAMAKIVQGLVNKAFDEIPKGFPSFDKGEDIFSFLIFRADWYNPSYRPERLFLTNQSLLARRDLPKPEDYRSFDLPAEYPGAPTKTIALADVFHGHSPLIAATSSSLPYLARAIEQAGFTRGRYQGIDIDNTYIIRISDGQYNSESNAADEHNVIARTAEQMRKKDHEPASTEDDGYEDHKKLAQLVNRVFEIGAQSAECALPTNKKGNALAIPFDCGPSAYKKVAGWGLGLLFSYLSVVPKVPALAGLVGTEKTRVPLKSVYLKADDDVHLEGTDPIRADSFTDPDGLYSLTPEKMQWRRDSGNWQPCDDLSRGASVNCNGGGPKLDFSQDNPPEQLRYRAEYLMEFSGQTGKPLLYPYARRLPWIKLPPVSLTSESIVEKYYELPQALTFSWVDPTRLGRIFNGGAAPKFPELDIGADQLSRLARDWNDELADLATDWQVDGEKVTPRMVARVSRDKKDEIEEQESRLNFYALAFYLISVLTALGLWLLLPRRRLVATVKHLVTDWVVLDFNDRSHERTLLVAMVRIENTRKNFTYTAGFARIQADLSAVEPKVVQNATANALQFSEPRRDCAPLGIGGPDRCSYQEKKPTSGRELPIFFDPREIHDLDQIAAAAEAAFELPVRVDLAAGRAGNDHLALAVTVKIVPETGKLDWDCEGLTVDADEHLRRRISYQAGKDEELLCTYILSSSAGHRYSTPVKGELKIETRDAQGRRLAGAVQLMADERQLDQLDFYLRYQDPKQIRVVVNFSKLENPIDQNEYRVTILEREVDGDEEPETPEDSLEVAADGASSGADYSVRQPWQVLQDWILVVERSTDKTECSVIVLESEQHRSDKLNAARLQLDSPFVVGSPNHPAILMPQPDPATNKDKLFTVRLANACRNGHGHADWAARIEVRSRQGVIFPEESLRLVDNHGDIRNTGRLQDSPDSTMREIDLGVEVDLNRVEFTRRDLTITVEVVVNWKVFKRLKDRPNHSEIIENRAGVICHLRHEPPRDVLAIDFGTSAMAIAHAAGPSSRVELLPLSRRLDEIERETKPVIERRRDDPAGRETPFLASELNVCLQDDRLAQTRPDAPEFLDLPLLKRAVYEHPEMCFSSLKSLLSAGFTELPLDARTHPYLNRFGELESSKSPPLDAVVQGAYRGLLLRYIEPLLDRSDKGYSHVYISHPNTYTRNHVEHLRSVVEQVFSGIMRGQNIVFPDNIHFVSESDAVAFHYLIHSHQLRSAGTLVPDRERILVYDIGAGTLDLTYLEVDWKVTGKGIQTPKRIRVRRRGGVTKAGDLLDECIARDLHDYLQSELDRDRYLTPLVVETAGEPMHQSEMRRMDALRQQIHRLKAQLSEGDDRPNLELSTAEANVARLVKTQQDQTESLYRGCSQLRATEAGAVYWDPGRNAILEGEFVQSFITQVTQVEVERFFGGQLPPLDTLILSGRTSLWPGFADRLRQTLGGVPNWVDFQGEADRLKQAVVLGVIEREFRWRNIQVEHPEVIGDFGVCLEPRADDWTFFHYPESGQSRSFDCSNAKEIRIGVRTNNGFHVCYSLLPDLFGGEDPNLTIRIEFDATGYLKADVTNIQGITKTFTGTKSIKTLDYKQRPWPLGAAKLHAMSPDEMFADQWECS